MFSAFYSKRKVHVKAAEAANSKYAENVDIWECCLNFQKAVWLGPTPVLELKLPLGVVLNRWLVKLRGVFTNRKIFQEESS